MDKRDFLFNFFGRENVSTAAGKAERAVEDLGKSFKATQGDAKSLDKEISKAQQGLQELAVKFARTADAAERMDLSKAMRKQQAEIRKLTKAKDLLPDMSKLGDDAGRGFGLSFIGKVGPIIAQAPLGPAGAAAGGIVAAAMAPVIGAAAAGAIIGGAGIGGVVGGLALAAKDPRVKAAGVSLKEAVTGDLEDFSKVFVGPAVEGIKTIRGAWSYVSDDVEKIFRASSGYVVPLARGVTGLAKEALPGIRKAVEAARPVIREISFGLPRLGRALSDVFSDSADNADEAAAGVRGVFIALEQVIRVGGGVVNVLAEMIGPVVSLGKVVSKVQDMLLGWIPGISEITDSWVSAWGEMDSALKGTADEASEGFFKMGAGAKDLTDQQAILNSSMRDGIAAAGGLSAAFDMLNGKALSAREAESNYQAAIDEVTASIKENGKTLDLNTAKGRANDAAVRNLIGTIDAKAQAVYDATLATKDQAAAEAAAKGVYEQGRQQLIKNLTQILGNKEAARKMADQIMKIPKSWSTDVKVNSAQAEANLKAVRSLISQIRSKKVVITTQHNQVITRSEGRNVGIGDNIGGRAMGGPIYGSGPKGVDSVLMKLAPGEHVLTAKEVDAAGGHKGVEQIRAALRAGGAKPQGSRLAPSSGVATASSCACPTEFVAEIPVQIGTEVIETVVVRLIAKSESRQAWRQGAGRRR